MKLKELEEKLKDGGVLVKTFYTRKIERHLIYVGVEERVTEKQWEEVLHKCINFTNDFSGITRHYYKLKK